MVQILPTLAVLPLEIIIPHERPQIQRTIPLQERLESSGILRNPPIVMPVSADSERFMLLDGANRVNAFRNIGIPHIVVQVVKQEDRHLMLRSWNHVILEWEPEGYLNALRDLPNIELLQGTPDESSPVFEKVCELAFVHLINGQSWTLKGIGDDIQTQVDCLHTLVNQYKTDCLTDRTTQYSLESLRDLYPELSALIIFPNFNVPQLIELASTGVLLPTGITRFIVSPRALHINYPLDALAVSLSTDEKNNQLRAWIHERIEHKGIRYYAEATVMYDE